MNLMKTNLLELLTSAVTLARGADFPRVPTPAPVSIDSSGRLRRPGGGGGGGGGAVVREVSQSDSALKIRNCPLNG